MSRRALLPLGLLGMVLLWATHAEAVRFRRPFNPGHALGNGYDNNGGGAGCSDYTCGGKCYNGHTGSDFPMPVGTDILAAATGTVVAVNQGCADYGYLGNPCGGRCGNYVRLSHDGGTSVYCHLRNGSLTVNVGQRVNCGQKIGESASSGSSTGPHLHFGWNPGGGAARDPYSGRCSNGGNAWVDQGPYVGAPGVACENNCECAPGNNEVQGCGRCGRRSRTCGGNCRWGGWSGCEGEGPCAPGARQDEACCDCGQRTRGCGGDCQWGGWGECGGPDPAGPPACDTGKPGDCAPGAVRCVTGCLTCTDTVQPSPEQCDDRDNDCDATTDEEANELAYPPPRYAAVIEDLSMPAALEPGERAQVWAVVRNVGALPWNADDAWLEAHGMDGEASPLWARGAWSAYDVPTLLAGQVLPGGSARVSFPIDMPAGDPPPTWFNLTVAGTPVACPAPGFELAPEPLAFAQAPADAGPDASPGESPRQEESARSQGGCAQAPAPVTMWWLIGLLAAARRRWHRCAPSPGRAPRSGR